MSLLIPEIQFDKHLLRASDCLPKEMGIQDKEEQLPIPGGCLRIVLCEHRSIM